MSNSKLKIFVGIDYGTTFSGIAYALPTASNGSDIQVVTDWPGNSGPNNEFLEKVPSIFAYLHENTNVANLPDDLWGYQVSSKLVNCSWTKLLLDRHARSTQYDDTTLKEPIESGLLRLPDGKSATDVATDYLKKLYEHCIKILGRHYADLLEMTSIEFWFTMPAMWSDKARDSTRKAAKKAGFGSRQGDSIKMITEPEAGVIAAINSPMKNIEGALEPQTGFLVCDCGGGTVDLTSYVVESTKPSLKLRETCPSIGGKCGATSIDRNFHALMRQRFGEAFTKLPRERIGPGSSFMREFEGFKKDFSESSYEVHALHLVMPSLDQGHVDPRNYDADYGDVKLSRDDLQQCFDPVVEQILKLVAQQTKANTENRYPKIETIILIGGFGCSVYLWEKLSAWGQANGNIRCISPLRPWSAIARGAALRGLEGSKVPFKKCRYHYGTTYDRPFDKSLGDDNTDSTWEHIKTGRTMVRHCMDWHFTRNEEISPDTRKEIPFTHWYYPDRPKRKGQLKFYSCALSKAPAKKSSLIDHVGTIEVNIRDVDLSTCDSGFMKGERVIWIKFTAIVTLGSEEGMMQVAVLWNGRKCGSGGFKFVHE